MLAWALAILLFQGEPSAERFAADQAQRRLLTRITQGQEAAAQNSADATPTRDLADEDLLVMLGQPTWVRRSHHPLSANVPWHHPAATELIRRCQHRQGAQEAIKPQIELLLRAKEDACRFNASYILAHLNDAQGLAVLSRALLNERAPVAVRAVAAEALSQFPDRLDSNVLKMLLDRWLARNSTAPAIVGDQAFLIAAVAFSWTNNRRLDPAFDPVQDPLVDRLRRTPSPLVRRAAAHAFGARAYETLPVALRDLLGDSEPSVRLTALEAVNEHPTIAAREAVLRLTSDSELAVAAAAVRELAKYRDAEVIARLVDLLSSPSATMREAAIRSAAVLGQESLVFKGIEDSATSVRQATAQVLGGLRSQDALAGLARLARQDRSSVVQLDAIRSLGEHASESSTAHLLTLLEASSAAARQEAAHELSKLVPEAAGFSASDERETRTRDIQTIRAALAKRGNEKMGARHAVLAEHANEIAKTIVERWFSSSDNRDDLLLEIDRLALQRSAIESAVLELDAKPDGEFVRKVLARYDRGYEALARVLDGSAQSDDISMVAAEFEQRSMSLLQAFIVTVSVLEHDQRDVWIRIVPLARKTLDQHIHDPSKHAASMARSAQDALAIRGLEHSDHVVRMTLCESLSGEEAVQHAQRLAILMVDADDRVRQAAIRAAGSTGHQDLRKSLKQALASPSVEIQIEAAAQLHRQGDREGADALRRLMAASDHLLRRRVVDAITASPHDREESLRLLTLALSDEKMEVRERAVAGLEKVVGISHAGEPHRRVPLDEQVNRWKRTLSASQKDAASDVPKLLQSIHEIQEKSHRTLLGN